MIRTFSLLLLAGSLLAQPTTVMVPMRDGVRLATDIYLPAGKGPWPAVLVRTPYNKTKKLAPDCWPDAWVPQGYAYVEQDWRGLFASEGKFSAKIMGGTQATRDGYDTVEWVAKQPWSNGKIGMIGGSGPGIAAKQAIIDNPPHLMAVYTNFASMFPADYEFYHGAVPVGQTDEWMAGRKAKMEVWPKPRNLLFGFQRFTWPPDHSKEAAAGRRIPLLDNGGWYDIFNPSAVDDFMARQSPVSRVVIGARGHAAMTGSLKYPPQALPFDTPHVWLDHWLKGEENGATAAPPILYFLMGDTLHPGAAGNVWKQAERWPVPNTPTSFYLSENGSLRRDAPADGKASRAYAFDPSNPVPSVGGNNMGDNKGPMDQTKLADRTDVLRFQTDALTEPLEITGAVTVELYVSADVPDTTVMAKLIDIHPNGYQALVLDAPAIARYRDGFERAVPMEKGEVYKMTLHLWNTALVFDKGHRIAVDVSGSNSPRFEVHPNSFQPVTSYAGAPVAHVSVGMSAKHASRLILPVIAPGASKDYAVARAAR